MAEVSLRSDNWKGPKANKSNHRHVGFMRHRDPERRWTKCPCTSSPIKKPPD